MAYKFIQASWVVEDLDSTISKWHSTTNAGPFFVNRHVELGNPMWRGQPSRFDTSLAIAQAGSMQIEFFQQHDDLPSPYRDSYPRGTEGFHHLGCFVDDIEAEIAVHATRGIEVALDCQFGDVRVVYLDTRATMGCMIEPLEHAPSIDALFAHIAGAAVDWDGTDPVRPIPDLSQQLNN